MAFNINTNISAMNAHAIGVQNNRALGDSLEKLSSGLRINKSADDASGMAIADSLRSQARTLGQAVKNGNDGIGIVQIADKAMDEQVKILDTIKIKATQAAQDGQTEDSRKMLQQDITKLMEELDNIAGTTMFNGQSLLSGSFTNKEFQIGAQSNQTIKMSINATSSDKIGATRFETGKTIREAHTQKLTFKAVDGQKDVNLESIEIGNSAGTGIGVLAETINKNSNALGVRASYSVLTTGEKAIEAGDSKLVINGVDLGTINDIKANDSDGKVISAINKLTDKHGIEAYIDERGRLNLKSIDGRGIVLGGDYANLGLSGDDEKNFGRLTLTRLDGRDIALAGDNLSQLGFGGDESVAVVNLRQLNAGFSADQASAMGMFENLNTSVYSGASVQNAAGIPIGIGAGVTTLKGAMSVMDIAETASKSLDKIRASMGSTQNQLVATINNISVTQVNVKAAESNIRDVDFATESANFQKNDILAQTGSYAMSQANAVQTNIMKLLT